MAAVPPMTPRRGIRGDPSRSLSSPWKRPRGTAIIVHNRSLQTAGAHGKARGERASRRLRTSTKPQRDRVRPRNAKAPKRMVPGWAWGPRCESAARSGRLGRLCGLIGRGNANLEQCTRPGQRDGSASRDPGLPRHRLKATPDRTDSTSWTNEAGHDARGRDGQGREQR